jgi:hypothetical protein
MSGFTLRDRGTILGSRAADRRTSEETRLSSPSEDDGSGSHSAIRATRSVANKLGSRAADRRTSEETRLSSPSEDDGSGSHSAIRATRSVANRLGSQLTRSCPVIVERSRQHAC